PFAEGKRGLDDLVGFRVDRDVSFNEGCLAAGLLDEAFGIPGGLRVPFEVDGDARPIARQPHGGRAPDAPARPGDERGAAFKSHERPKLAGTWLRRAAPWATDAPSA